MGKNKKKKNIKKLKGSLDVRDLFDDEIGLIPSEITRLSPENIRDAHSYWVTAYNYCSSQLAVVQSKSKQIKMLRDAKYKQLYVQLKGMRQTNEAARYNAELHPTIMRADKRLYELSKEESQWSVYTEQCDSYRKLCSREQSYREAELKDYFGKGGRGK